MERAGTPGEGQRRQRVGKKRAVRVGRGRGAGTGGSRDTEDALPTLRAMQASMHKWC